MPSSLKMLQRYHYDAVDRLSATGISAHGSIQRFYQGNYLATELGEHSQRAIFRHEAEPLAQRKAAASLNENTLLAADQAHSLLHSLTQYESEYFAHTAYGHYPAESGFSSLLGFNGESPDAVTGHYLLGRGKRAFNPVLMRFNSPDNLSPFGEGGINPYAYCKGDPINRYDPTGNAPVFTTPKNPPQIKVPLVASSINISRRRPSASGPRSLDRSQQSNFNTLESAPGTSRPTRPSIPDIVEQDVPSTTTLIRYLPEEKLKKADMSNSVYKAQIYDNLVPQGRITRLVTSKQSQVIQELRAHIREAPAASPQQITLEALAITHLKIKEKSYDSWEANMRKSTKPRT